MNLRQLQQFVTLMETRNFHRAAALLHMAQPPLSVSIRRLEEELGGKLFERHASGLIPTSIAQSIEGDARTALFHAEQCKIKAQEAMRGLQGLLRIGFIVTATHKLLPQLIPGLREAFPKIQLDLCEMTSLEISNSIQAQQIDIGFLRFPILGVQEIDVFPLERDDFVLAVPSDNRYAKTSNKCIPLSLMADDSFILYPTSRVPSLAGLAYIRCQLSGFSPHVVQEAMQVPTILSLVASGCGVALVAGVARQATTPGVAYLELSDTPPEFCIGMGVAVPRNHRSVMVSRVLHYVLKNHQTPEMQKRSEWNH
jgi:DNA-binding transcriptional LysR family regulator